MKTNGMNLTTVYELSDLNGRQIRQVSKTEQIIKGFLNIGKQKLPMHSLLNTAMGRLYNILTAADTLQFNALCNSGVDTDGVLVGAGTTVPNHTLSDTALDNPQGTATVTNGATTSEIVFEPFGVNSRLTVNVKRKIINKLSSALNLNEIGIKALNGSTHTLFVRDLITKVLAATGDPNDAMEIIYEIIMTHVNTTYGPGNVQTIVHPNFLKLIYLTLITAADTTNNAKFTDVIGGKLGTGVLPTFGNQDDEETPGTIRGLKLYVTSKEDFDAKNSNGIINYLTFFGDTGEPSTYVDNEAFDGGLLEDTTISASVRKVLTTISANNSSSASQIILTSVLSGHTAAFNVFMTRLFQWVDGAVDTGKLPYKFVTNFTPQVGTGKGINVDVDQILTIKHIFGITV